MLSPADENWPKTHAIFWIFFLGWHLSSHPQAMSTNDDKPRNSVFFKLNRQLFSQNRRFLYQLDHIIFKYFRLHLHPSSNKKSPMLLGFMLYLFGLICFIGVSFCVLSTATLDVKNSFNFEAWLNNSCFVLPLTIMLSQDHQFLISLKNSRRVMVKSFVKPWLSW